MRKIKYAIIGFGGIVENRIASEGFARDGNRFKEIKGFELVGATDSNPAKKKTVIDFGLKWYETTEQLLKDSEIDAVFIASNNLSHAQIAKTVIRAGKHCIIEKPIATTVEDAEELCRLAKDYKVSLSVDHMMTKNSYSIKAKELLKAGAIGKVNDICLHMEFLYGAVPEEAKTWRCSNIDELGGPIGDVASHCMYMAEFLLDSRIRSLSCAYYPKTLDIKTENGAYIKFNMKNGVSGSIKVAFSEPRGGLIGTLSGLGYEIYGSEGIVRTYGTLFQLSGHTGEPVKLRLDIDNGDTVKSMKIKNIENIYQSMISEHAASISTGKILNAEDAVWNLKLIKAAHQSARNKMIRTSIF